MPVTAVDKKRIALGSGKLYVVECVNDNVIPDDATIETEENILGAISGGASIEYKGEFYTAKDDLGLAEKTIMTGDEALLKSGVMTWNGNTLKKLCNTARVTDDVTKKIRTVKVGGVGNQDGKKYIIRFVSDDKQDNIITKITIVGQNQAGFVIAFAKDKETVMNVEFKALPCDNEGTKIVYSETITTTD